MIIWIVAGVVGLALASMISWGLVPALFVRSVSPMLDGRHDDWPWIFKYIPRRWSAFTAGRGEPKQILGNNPEWHNQDIPAKGTWCVSWPLHFVARSQENLTLAFGVRYDYNGRFYTLRFTLKRVDYGV